MFSVDFSRLLTTKSSRDGLQQTLLRAACEAGFRSRPQTWGSKAGAVAAGADVSYSWRLKMPLKIPTPPSAPRPALPYDPSRLAG